MRRTAALLLAAALSLLAQSARQPYRDAYRAWRQAEPDLEREAATGTDAVAASASHAAEEAANFGAARSAFLHRTADEQTKALAWLQRPAPPPLADLAPPRSVLGFVTSETATVNASIATFANDPDRGIQQLRQALERERSALTALRTAIEDRQKAGDKAVQAAAAAEQGRNKALDQYQKLAASLSGSAAAMELESAAWAAYYQKLSEAARAPVTPVAPPVTSSVRPAGPAPSPAPVETAAAPPPAAPRTPSITPLPLVRYTGGWTYPEINGVYHGAQPQSIDLEVAEQNGHVTGAFTGRFKLPAGSTGDPVVRFSFSGDLRATRNQSFALETPDGAKGTIELIPGNAFNLLEVTFQTDLRPGKIRAGDMILLKK